MPELPERTSSSFPQIYSACNSKIYPGDKAQETKVWKHLVQKDTADWREKWLMKTKPLSRARLPTLFKVLHRFHTLEKTVDLCNREGGKSQNATQRPTDVNTYRSIIRLRGIFIPDNIARWWHEVGEALPSLDLAQRKFSRKTAQLQRSINRIHASLILHVGLYDLNLKTKTNQKDWKNARY